MMSGAVFFFPPRSRRFANEFQNFHLSIRRSSQREEVLTAISHSRQLSIKTRCALAEMLRFQKGFHSCIPSDPTRFAAFRDSTSLLVFARIRSSYCNIPGQKETDLMCHSPLRSRTPHIVLVGVSTASLPIMISLFRCCSAVFGTKSR